MSATNAIPIKKNKVFLRKENDGVTLLYTDLSGIQLLNKTGTLIYSLIDGEKTINDICLAVSRNYEKALQSQVYEDTQNFLYSLKNKGLLRIKEETSKMAEGCSVIGERNYEDVSNFIKKYLSKDNSIIVGFLNIPDKIYYSTIAIRTRSFNLNETFFTYVKDNKILSMISVLGLDTISFVPSRVTPKTM